MPLGNTSYLQIETMAENDTDKYLIFNDAIQQVDDATNRLLSLDASAGNVTLTESQFTKYVFFQVTGNAVARDLIIPATVGSGPTVTTNRPIFVDNTGTAALTVKHPTGLTVVLAAGAGGTVYCDGTDIRLMGSSATGAPVPVQEEGSETTAAPTAINFVGAGATATDVAGVATITIPSVPFQEEGVDVTAAPTKVNFVGTPVTVTDVSGVATVTITEGAGISSAEKTAAYTVVSADFSGNKLITINTAGAVNVTVNTGLTGDEPVTIVQEGAGQVTFNGTATINSADGNLKLRVQYSSATLIPDAQNTDTFYLVGDLAA